MKLRDRRAQDGFGIVELLIIIVVVALLIVVGWVAYHAMFGEDDKQRGDTKTREDSVPKIERSEDLPETEAYLNDINLDEQLNTREIDDALSGS